VPRRTHDAVKSPDRTHEVTGMSRAVSGAAALLLAIQAAPAAAVPPPAPDEARVVAVIDGDTITVNRYGDPFRVRLACIDAPELGQGEAGAAARAALERLLPVNIWVSCRPEASRRTAPSWPRCFPWGRATRRT